MVPKQKFNPRTGKFEVVTPTPTPTTQPSMGGFMGGLSGNTATKAVPAKAGTTPVKPVSTTVPKKPTAPTVPRRNTQVAPQGPVRPAPRSSMQGQGVAGQPRIDDPTETQTMVDKIVAGVALTPAEIALYQSIFGGGGSGGGLTEAQKLEQQRIKDANSFRAGNAAAGIQEQAGVDAQTQYGALAKTGYDTAVTGAGGIYDTGVKDTNAVYDAQLDNLQKYIDAQRGSATGSINTATADLLAGLKGTTAYNDVVGSNIAAPTQGLGDMLKSYGGTGQSAQEQANMDAASAKQIADMFTRSNKQLAGAETDYYTGLQNSARGADAADKQNLAAVLASIQGQDRAGIQDNRRGELSGLQNSRRGELSGLQTDKTNAVNTAGGIKDQLLTKGIESLMSGKQAGATTRAQTTASYGPPVSTKPKPKDTPQIIKKEENLAKAPKNPVKGQVWKDGPQGKNWAWDGKNWVAKTAKK
jgi:hypothetical protein